MAEDRCLQVSQRLARFDAQLFNERCAAVLVDGERLDLLAGAIEGKHQELTQAFTEWVLTYQRVEFGHDRPMSAQREIGPQSSFQGNQAQLLQPGDLAAGEVLVAKLR